MENLQRDPDGMTSSRADEIDCWDEQDVSIAVDLIAKMSWKQFLLCQADK
jgi:hypothetical protein